MWSQLAIAVIADFLWQSKLIVFVSFIRFAEEWKHLWTARSKQSLQAGYEIDIGIG